jgi:hypothetical protein
MRRSLCLVGVVWIALVSGGCGVTLEAGRPARMPGDAIVVREAQSARCVRSPHGAGNTFREELPGAVTDPELLPYLARFGPEVRRTAVAAGVEPLLARLLRERERVHGEPTLELLEMRQELAERVSALPGQLLAVEFECECIGAAIGEALEAHEDSEDERERALTIATLVTGAGVGLVAGGWDLANNHTATPDAPDGPLVTAIVGGLVTTALGAAILVPNSHPMVFVHEHNLLAPIASGVDERRLYPTFVFRMLSMPVEGAERTPREALLAEWEAEWSDSVDEADRALAETLVYLFQQLETALDSLARHVDALSRAIADALADADADADADANADADEEADADVESGCRCGKRAAAAEATAQAPCTTGCLK